MRVLGEEPMPQVDASASSAVLTVAQKQNQVAEVDAYLAKTIDAKLKHKGTHFKEMAVEQLKKAMENRLKRKAEGKRKKATKDAAAEKQKMAAAAALLRHR